MRTEHSAGAILFVREKEKIFYLLLKYPQGHWDSPRGHIEKGETIKKALAREIKEETGITNFQYVFGFHEKGKIWFKDKNGLVLKIVDFLLVETNQKEVRLSEEHLDYKWLEYHQLKDYLKFKGQKEVFRKAKEFLENKDYFLNLN